MPTTTVLKSKEDILLDRKPGNDAGIYDDDQIFIAMSQYAEQNSTAFVRWRSDLSVVIKRRYILDMKIEDQYKLFIKENNL